MIKTIFKNFITLFKPSRYKEPYPWLKQQFVHQFISYISFMLVASFIFSINYLTGGGSPLKPVAFISMIFTLAFWSYWEINQYKKTKDFKDLAEDLSFEYQGAIAGYFIIFLYANGWNIFLAITLPLLINSLIIFFWLLLKFKLYKTK